jgi:hypothetical protein
MAEQWMSIVEYARSFSVSDMTVRRRIKNGKLHAVLKDGKYFIPVDGAKHMTHTQTPVISQQVNHESYQPAIASTPDRVGAFSPMLISKDNEDSQIPYDIKANLTKQESCLVDTSELLGFCESSLTSLKTLEKHIEENYKNKYALLEEKIRYKDLELARLKQQVEDLQTLIHMMESSS